jgi:predicted AlkP superfamily phosphohydrolase/phosphomutase
VEPISSCFKDISPIWKILNRYGVSTGIMNVPGTYPPDEVNGFMVTGLMTPSKRNGFSYPPTLGADLESNVREYEIDLPYWQYFDEGTFVKDLYKVTEKRGLAAEYLIGHIPCEFYMVVFTSCDRLHHLMWKYRDVVEAYWEELDKVLGRILEHFGDETTVFMVSDHGFAPLERTFFVNEWLNKQGYLKVKPQFIKRSLVKFGRFVEGIYKFLGEMKLVKPITNFLKRIIGLDTISKYFYSYLSNMNLESRVNWDKTKAFSCLHTPEFGQIYVNLEGKMQDGFVSNTERDLLVERVIEELRELPGVSKGDTSRVEVWKAENLYHGPYVESAPDIVFSIDGGRCEIDAKVGEGRIFADGAPLTSWTGTHVKDGVFIACGPEIKKDFRLEGASIMDVTPTVLKLFGVPQNNEMDGRILDEIFVEDVVFKEKERLLDYSDGDHDISALTLREKALIEARLRKLGYI